MPDRRDENAVCLDCDMRGVQNRLAGLRTGTPVDPAQEDQTCRHFRPEYWEEKGFKRGWGDAAVMNWPYLEILRREGEGSVEYVVLSPLFTRRPVTIYAHAAKEGIDSWGSY